MNEAERKHAIETAHALVGRTCESWRRSLLVDGPTDHLHHIECTRVAGLAADLATAVELLTNAVDSESAFVELARGDGLGAEPARSWVGDVRSFLARVAPKGPAR